MSRIGGASGSKRDQVRFRNSPNRYQDCQTCTRAHPNDSKLKPRISRHLSGQGKEGSGVEVHGIKCGPESTWSNICHPSPPKPKKNHDSKPYPLLMCMSCRFCKLSICGSQVHNALHLDSIQRITLKFLSIFILSKHGSTNPISWCTTF